MKMSLDIIEEKIKQIVPDIPIKKVFIKKANKKFLCACVEGSASSIRLYDENYGLDHVACIDYRANDTYCFISNFETEEELQGLGLGRFVYNMALAHADMLGANRSYGYINPVNNIKGVSDFCEDSFEKEMEFLQNVYKNLGNTIIPEEEGLKFCSKWKSKERIKILTKPQKQLLKEFVEQTNINKIY